MGGVAAQHQILFLFISSMIFRHVGMLQQISSNKKIYACPYVGAPFLWGPLCGRTGRTCLNPPLLKSMRKSKNRYFYHIFVSPGDAPVAITQNFA